MSAEPSGERYFRSGLPADPRSSFAAWLMGDWAPPIYQPNLPPDFASALAKDVVQQLQGGAR